MAVAQIESEKPRCVWCKSTNLKVYKTDTKKQETTRNNKGELFNHIVRRYCRCEDCSRRMALLTHEYRKKRGRPPGSGKKGKESQAAQDKPIE